MIEKYENMFGGKELWVVADGPSCPSITISHAPILAVNHGFRNVDGRVFGLVYLDPYFRKNFQGDLTAAAEYIFHPEKLDAPNAVRFRKVHNHRQNRLRDGVYVGRGISHSSGCAALSLALGLTSGLIRLFGFDYRVFTAAEAMEYFGRVVGVHASKANHRTDDPRRKKLKNGKIYPQKIESFDRFANETRIVNHSIHSNLHQFERVQISI